MAHSFSFDRERLGELAARYRRDYVEAEPFPHVVIDDFLPADAAERLAEEFPEADHPVWRAYEHQHSKKRACSDFAEMADFTRHLISQLNSSVFVNFLEELTSIEGLIPDAHLVGGGLHRIERGGFLDVHADFNFHPKWQLDRRLNLLLYLNKDWEEEFGGHLELWDRQMTRRVKAILPVFNRFVLFSTTDFSYHGHPEPLNCPEGRARKSLALYYYSNGRPAEEASGAHSTLYHSRLGAGASVTEPRGAGGRSPGRGIASKVIPPIVADLLKSSKKRLKGE